MNNSIVEIDQQLSELSLIRRDIPKDGSCLFRCVSESVYGNQNYHFQIRILCVKYLSLNRDIFEPFACVNTPWERYLELMKQEGTWGGDVELQALSLIFQINFIIYFGKGQTRIDNQFKNSISLAYSSGEHYDLVYTIKHFNNYKYFQTIVYDLLFKSIKYNESSSNSINTTKQFVNIPLKQWEIDDAIKQKRDSKIVDKLSKVQSVNVLDDYQKKQNKNSAKPVNKNRRQNNLNKSNNSDKGSQPPSLKTSINEEPIDDELRDILKQIEQQEQEEQRLLGLEKHFPNLGNNVNGNTNKSGKQNHKNQKQHQQTNFTIQQQVQIQSEPQSPPPQQQDQVKPAGWGAVSDWSKAISEYKPEPPPVEPEILELIDSMEKEEATQNESKSQEQFNIKYKNNNNRQRNRKNFNNIK